jgi:hypothetical protein
MTGPLARSRRRRGLVAALAIGSASALLAAACTNNPGGGWWPRRTTTTRPTATTMDHGNGGMDHGPMPDRLNHPPTPAQIERAKKLVADTKAATVKYRTTAAAVAAGYNNIGDNMHYTNAAYRHDGRELDPQHIESLVYNLGTQQLMAAMYNMEPETTFDTVEDIAGNWTIFHNHDNLCWKSNDPNSKDYTRLGGVVGANGQCTKDPITGKPSYKHTPVLMIHVWVIANSCGPFATIPGEGEGSCLPNFPNP